MWPSIALETDEVEEAFDDCAHVVTAGHDSILIIGVVVVVVLVVDCVMVEDEEQVLTTDAIDVGFDGFPVDVLLERLEFVWFVDFFFLELLAMLCISFVVMLSVVVFFLLIFK